MWTLGEKKNPHIFRNLHIQDITHIVNVFRSRFLIAVDDIVGLSVAPSDNLGEVLHCVVHCDDPSSEIVLCHIESSPLSYSVGLLFVDIGIIHPIYSIVNTLWTFFLSNIEICPHFGYNPLRKGVLTLKIATSQDRLNELFDSDPRNDTAIAAELNVSKQTISAWRAGTRSPKKDMILKIAELYHVSIEWLMGFDVDRPDIVITAPDEQPVTIEAKILAKGIDRLPKEQREQALSMFKLMFAPQYADLFTKENEDDT